MLSLLLSAGCGSGDPDQTFGGRAPGASGGAGAALGQGSLAGNGGGGGTSDAMLVAGGGGQAMSASDGGVQGGDGTAATGWHAPGGSATIGSDGAGGRLGQPGGQPGSDGGPQSTGGSTRTGGAMGTGTGASAGAGAGMSRGTGGASVGGGVAGTTSGSGGGTTGRGSGGAGGSGRVETGGAAGRAGSGGATSGGGASACRQAPVPLGAAGDFAVLAGSTVTSTGLTLVTGALGTSPGTAVTGFPPGQIIGSITGPITGSPHAGDAAAAEGQAMLTTAYGDVAGRMLCPVTIVGNLGGQTLPPGLYKSTSSLEISSGNLTLDAGGDASAVWIFQMASTLTTTSGRQVILSGGARSSNVFWQVGTSATLGVSSVFQGTVISDQSITLTTGATLNGRVLARIGAVTLDSNTIVKPAP